MPKNDRVYRLVGYLFNTRFLGQGIVTETNKEVWRHKRALLNPAFHRTFVKHFQKLTKQIYLLLIKYPLKQKFVRLPETIQHSRRHAHGEIKNTR